MVGSPDGVEAASIGAMRRGARPRAAVGRMDQEKKGGACADQELIQPAGQRPVLAWRDRSAEATPPRPVGAAIVTPEATAAAAPAEAASHRHKMQQAPESWQGDRPEPSVSCASTQGGVAEATAPVSERKPSTGWTRPVANGPCASKTNARNKAVRVRSSAVRTLFVLDSTPRTILLPGAIPPSESEG
jgi:hypothetical protein